MSKAMEIMRNESEIQGSIRTAKALGLPDDKNVAHLVSMYDSLSEEEATKLVKEYEN